MVKTLGSNWTWGARIGGGGFADVYEASNGDGKQYAAKFVTKEPSAERETLIAGVVGTDHVMPVLEIGEENGYYVLVMPRAERSLKDVLDVVGMLPVDDALEVMVDVASALVELGNGVSEREVVHRDLKPANVLRFDGRWCLTDFGIARYADAATETHTRRLAKSRPYAAPEQWEERRATAKTDVYAFGVMAYELVEGKRPFDGPDWQLRDAHIKQPPPVMQGATPEIRALIAECLLKAPAARPSPDNLLARLRSAQLSMGDDRWRKLAAANGAEIERRTIRDTAAAEARSDEERRDQLRVDAESSWTIISERVRELVETHLSAAEFSSRTDRNWSVSLNGARFGISWPKQKVTVQPGDPFEVISSSTVTLLTDRGDGPNLQLWSGRSHSLYFCDLETEGQFGWYETAFMRLGNGGISDQAPFADDEFGPSWQYAFGNVMGPAQVAWQPTRLTPGDCDDFAERWLNWFADASQGQLRRPHQLPETNISKVWNAR